MMKISIITVCFNSESTIQDTIRSVSEQSYKNIEYIIIDGKSTDNTLSKIDSYRDKIKHIVSEPDNGIYDAMNKGMRLASGDIIGILNADDYYAYNGVLADVVKTFEDSPVDTCYGDLFYVNASDTQKIVRYWKSGDFYPNNFYHGWMPPHPTFFVRRSIYEKYGLFNLNLGSAADYEIMLRFLLKYNVNAKYIPKTLVHMRAGGVSNASLGSRLKANRMDRKAWKVNGLKPYPWTLMMKPLRKLKQWKMKHVFSILLRHTKF